VKPQFRLSREIRVGIVTAFPKLNNLPWKYRSPYDDTYKCIAWAAGRTDNIWWPVDDDPPPPGVYWPPGVPRDLKVSSFIQAFEVIGYECCSNSDFEFGYQKVAIYALDPDETTHMARQHFFGRGWLSKPGELEDIIHPTLESIESNLPSYVRHRGYGKVFQIMKRSWWRGLMGVELCRCVWWAFFFWCLRLVKRPL
jgi:hypothetical protein